MAKCGPKPKQISIRQLRNLIREEKKASAAQRSVRQLLPTPPSPRPKKRIYTRPSRLDVSLARKKQVKIKPRSAMVRKARTESSVAFSGITEEIPLFDVVKRASNLIHMPQAPVPLVCPTTPPRTTAITGIDTLKMPPRVLDASPGLDLGGRTELLVTPRVATTSQPQPPSTLNPEENAELKFQPCSFSPTFGHDLACTSPDVQNTPTQVDPDSFVSSSRNSIIEDLMQVQVLSQLPMEPESCLLASPKVLLPKKPLLVDKCPERNIGQADSPETSYHRSLMTSIWAQPLELSLVRKQLDLRDVLHVHHPNNDILSSAMRDSIQETTKPTEQLIKKNRLISDTQTTASCPSDIAWQADPFAIDVPRQDTTQNPQPIGPEATVKFGDTEASHSYNLNRGGFDGHGARRSSVTNHTPGAYANAVLRQTGHLRKRDVLPPEHVAGDFCKPPASNSVLRIEKDRKAQDSLRGHEKSKLFNSLRFQSIRNESLQSRAPTSLPHRTSLDGPKLPFLAPAAIIRNDPFIRPSERPTRKRVISVGRVLDFTATTPCEVQGTHAEALGISDIRRNCSKQSTAGANMATHRPRSKRHWTKRVVVDDICHRVSTEGSPVGAGGYIVAPWIGSEAGTPLNVFPTLETGNTFKQRITMTLRAMYNKLWA